MLDSVSVFIQIPMGHGTYWFGVVMRKEAVYTVLLNAPLFKGMRCSLAQDPRYLRFSVFENGATTHYNLRVRHLLPIIFFVAQVLLGHECEDCGRITRRD